MNIIYSQARSEAPKRSISNTLVDQIGQVFIVAHKEQTQRLEAVLEQEGLICKVLRQRYREEYQNFSPSYLCLLNHRRAWEQAVRQRKPILVVEADFVPVVGFGRLPLPFDSKQPDVGIAWLYTCAPQVYNVSKEGYAQGYSTSMVAYVVTPQGAECLLELAEEIKEKIGPTNYSSWDSSIDRFLLDRKLKNYIPFRNYGEHGGRPNPEHQRNGLSRTHRADVLYGRLAFSPPYAFAKKSDRSSLLFARLQARCKGIARLAAGRFLRPKVLKHSSVPGRLLRFAIARQLSLRI